MRPAEARQISIARSRAQSECGELSTGTKTSLYGMTPPSAVMGSLNGFSELLGFFAVRCFSRYDLQSHSHAPNSARDMKRRETCVKGRVIGIVGGSTALSSRAKRGMCTRL